MGNAHKYLKALYCFGAARTTLYNGYRARRGTLRRTGSAKGEGAPRPCLQINMLISVFPAFKLGIAESGIRDLPLEIGFLFWFFQLFGDYSLVMITCVDCWAGSSPKRVIQSIYNPFSINFVLFTFFFLFVLYAPAEVAILLSCLEHFDSHVI